MNQLKKGQSVEYNGPHGWRPGYVVVEPISPYNREYSPTCALIQKITTYHDEGPFSAPYDRIRLVKEPDEQRRSPRQSVECHSGITGWQGRLQDQYEWLADFKAHNAMYGLANTLGYKSAEEAWNANPLIQGSVVPSDYCRVEEESKRLTDEDVKNYVKAGGTYCPYCGGDHLWTGQWDIQKTACFRQTGCEDCKREWTDEYSLTGITEDE